MRSLFRLYLYVSNVANDMAYNLTAQVIVELQDRKNLWTQSPN